METNLFYLLLLTCILIIIFPEWNRARWKIDSFAVSGVLPEFCPWCWERQYHSPYATTCPEFNSERPYFGNLDDLLSPLGAQNCFILLNNFLNGNYPPPTVPVAVRYQNIEELHFQNRGSKSSLKLDEDIEMYFNRQNHPRHSINWLELQENYTTRPINLLHYSGKIRPWNCQAHVQLFPNVQLFEYFTIPPIFWYNGDSRLFKLIPSSVPKLKILITQELLHLEYRYNCWWTTNVVARWILNNDCEKSINAHTVLLAGRVKPNPFVSTLLGGSGYIIVELELQKAPCYAPFGNVFFYYKYLQPDAFTLKLDDLSNIQNLSEFALSKYQDLKDLLGNWGLVDIINHLKNEIGDYINFCDNDGVYAGSPSLFKSAKEKISHLHFHLWLGLFVDNPPFVTCVRGKLSTVYISEGDIDLQMKYWEPIFKFKVLPEQFLNSVPSPTFPVITQSSINSFKFVCCGKRG